MSRLFSAIDCKADFYAADSLVKRSCAFSFSSFFLPISITRVTFSPCEPEFWNSPSRFSFEEMKFSISCFSIKISSENGSPKPSRAGF